MLITQNCNNCLHKNVCKDIQSYRFQRNQLIEFAKSFTDADLVKVDVKCANFVSELIAIKSLDVKF